MGLEYNGQIKANDGSVTKINIACDTPSNAEIEICCGGGQTVYLNIKDFEVLKKAVAKFIEAADLMELK